jgi:hypothetical protein
MPDLLSHLGAGAVIMKGMTRRADLGCVLLGSILPDLGWMARRALAAGADFNPVVVSQWVIPWHTPWTMLWVCGALLSVSVVGRRGAAIVWVAALVHCLLDGAQTRYGDGVLFFYPFSLRQFSWRLFWPESPFNHALAIGSGLLLAVLLLRRSPPLPPPAAADPGVVARRRGTMRWGAAGLILVVPLFSAWLTRDRLLRANVSGLGLATAPAAWAGQVVGIDRDEVVGVDPLRVRMPAGTEFFIDGADRFPDAPVLSVGDTISVLGICRDGRIVATDLHRHREWIRSGYSFAALLGLLIWTWPRRGRALAPGTGALG